MKKYIALLLLAFASIVNADYRIQATVTLTNYPLNSGYITINADTRTFYTSVTNTLTEIQQTNSVGWTTTNLFLHLLGNIPAGPMAISLTATNVITLYGSANQAMSIDCATNWATVTYSTNTFGLGYSVHLPASDLLAGPRARQASGLIDNLNNDATNSLVYGIAMANFVDLTTVQVVSNKTLVSPAMTNAVNYGDAFQSPGSGDYSTQVGGTAITGTIASGKWSSAFGVDAEASGEYSTALGMFSVASGYGSSAVGRHSIASGTNSISVGWFSYARTNDSIAIGTAATSEFTNSIAIGSYTTNTAANQILIGSSSHTIQFGGLINGPTITNTTIYGTLGNVTNGSAYNLNLSSPIATNLNAITAITISGDELHAENAITTLATGANNIDMTDKSFAVIRSAPAGAFSISGISGGGAGKIVRLVNKSSQNMTLTYESGLASNATNRIDTLTGADWATTADGSATLIYSTTEQRWQMLSGVQ